MSKHFNIKVMFFSDKEMEQELQFHTVFEEFPVLKAVFKVVTYINASLLLCFVVVP